MKQTYGLTDYILKRIWRGYIIFVLSLLKTKVTFQTLEMRSWANYEFGNNDDSSVSYSTLTLNYDRVLENVCEYINRRYPCNTPEYKNIAFDDPRTAKQPSNNKFEQETILAKLHGSTDGSSIVLPTWSKGSDKGVRVAWKADTCRSRQSDTNPHYWLFASASGFVYQIFAKICTRNWKAKDQED